MAKNAHLTFDERVTIETCLRDRLSFREIGSIIGKDPSTISKEIRGHYKVHTNNAYNPCMHRRTCMHHGDLCRRCHYKGWGRSCQKCKPPCYTHCPDFEEKICLQKQKPPYVCNGCKERMGCKLQRHLYDAKYAQKEYESVRSESRQGFAITSDELKRIDAIISPLVQQGHSIHHTEITEEVKVPWSKKLRWLTYMLWGGAVLLAFEHIWHGEVVPWFPFLTAMSDPADAAEMFHEMATVGVTMAVLITLVWIGMCLAADAIMRRPAKAAVQKTTM